MDGFQRAFPVDGTRDRFLARLDGEGRRDAFDARLAELKAGAKTKQEKQQAFWQAVSEFAPSPPEDDGQTGDDLVDPALFVGKWVHPLEAIGWVANNLAFGGLTPTDAPSADAWDLLCWARSSKGDFRKTYYRELVRAGPPPKQPSVDEKRVKETLADIMERTQRVELESWDGWKRWLLAKPKRWEKFKSEVESAS